MEEKKYMEMYENMFASFQEQTRLYMVAAIEKQKNNESLSLDMLDSFKSNLINMINTLGSSLSCFTDEQFKNFYKAKIDYSYRYIEDLNSFYKESNVAKNR